MYKSFIKKTVIKTVTTTTSVYVQATDAKKAKLQLEAIYGKNSVIQYPQKIN